MASILLAFFPPPTDRTRAVPGREVCNDSFTAQHECLAISNDLVDGQPRHRLVGDVLRVVGIDDRGLEYALGSRAGYQLSTGAALQIRNPADMVPMLLRVGQVAHVPTW